MIRFAHFAGVLVKLDCMAWLGFPWAQREKEKFFTVGKGAHFWQSGPAGAFAQRRPKPNICVTSRKVALEWCEATTLTNRVSFYPRTVSDQKSRDRPEHKTMTKRLKPIWH